RQVVERQQQRRREVAVGGETHEQPEQQQAERKAADVAEEEFCHRPVERRKAEYCSGDRDRERGVGPRQRAELRRDPQWAGHPMAKRQRAPKTPRTAPTREWPLFRSLASYRMDFLPGDLVAGLTLAAIAIPEQMATARLGHFTPQVGLIVLVAAALAFAAFGGNPLLSCGAGSTITPILYRRPAPARP